MTTDCPISKVPSLQSDAMPDESPRACREIPPPCPTHTHTHTHTHTGYPGCDFVTGHFGRKAPLPLPFPPPLVITPLPPRFGFHLAYQYWNPRAPFPLCTANPNIHNPNTYQFQGLQSTSVSVMIMESSVLTAQVGRFPGHLGLLAAIGAEYAQLSPPSIRATSYFELPTCFSFTS